MPNEKTKPDDEHAFESFDALVVYLTWELMEALTKGVPLRSTVFRLANIARTVKIKDQK